MDEKGSEDVDEVARGRDGIGPDEELSKRSKMLFTFDF